MATIEEVAEALKARGISVEIVDVGDPGEPNPGINLRMADPHQRVADDTLWPPVPVDQMKDDGWCWGRRFEHSLPASTTAEQIAEAIENTVRAR